MNILLSKPAGSDWQLIATDASKAQLEEFNAAVGRTVFSVGEDDWCRSSFDFPTSDFSTTSCTWVLRVGPFLAMYIAYLVGKKMNVTVGLGNIGD